MVSLPICTWASMQMSDDRKLGAGYTTFQALLVDITDEVITGNQEAETVTKEGGEGGYSSVCGTKARRLPP